MHCGVAVGRVTHVLHDFVVCERCAAADLGLPRVREAAGLPRNDPVFGVDTTELGEGVVE